MRYVDARLAINSLTLLIFHSRSFSAEVTGQLEARRSGF
jgi:hypothetical protein